MDRYILVNRIIDKEGSAEVCEAYTYVNTLFIKNSSISFFKHMLIQQRVPNEYASLNTL